MSKNRTQSGETAQIFLLEVCLHARPAALLVKLAQRFETDIVIECNQKHASAKSILGVLTLSADEGMNLRVTAKGQDAPEAIQAIRELLAVLGEETKSHSSRRELSTGTLLAQAG